MDTAAVQLVADALAGKPELEALARERRLGPRERKLMGAVADRPPMPPTPVAELVPARIVELGQALSAARSPHARQVLGAELERLKALAAQFAMMGQTYQPSDRDDYRPQTLNFTNDMRKPEVLRGPVPLPQGIPNGQRM